jgi:hypothetical protein
LGKGTARAAKVDIPCNLGPEKAKPSLDIQVLPFHDCSFPSWMDALQRRVRSASAETAHFA